MWTVLFATLSALSSSCALVFLLYNPIFTPGLCLRSPLCVTAAVLSRVDAFLPNRFDPSGGGETTEVLTKAY